MLEIGKTQTGIIRKITPHGAYLSEPGSEEDTVLLPHKYVPSEASVNDEVIVFVYKDSEDRIIATTQSPKITLGQTAVLKVVQSTNIGAFLDWGLDKDLLLPFKEQSYPVKEGEEVLTALYEDKSRRLCGTMKVYEYLKNDPPYEANDKVTARVYQIHKELGAFLAVDDCYYGMIPKQELYENLKPGDIIEARVLKRRSDGKLDLTPRKKAYKQMEEDAQMVLALIEDYNGILPFNDKADPDTIKKEAGLSKNAFKRAVGQLLKNGLITLDETTISLHKET